MKIGRACLMALLILCLGANASYAWGGRGHRTVAAIAMMLIPEKASKINSILAQLEFDNNFIDAASYPDEYIRDHDPEHQFGSWHFADLVEHGSFQCGECLFKALPNALDAMGHGPDDKQKAIAIAWVIHLVGDLHQPLHMSGRLRGGNEFKVTYRGHGTCQNFGGHSAKVELHSAWDDCLVEELASGRDPRTLARDLLGGISTYKGRDETKANDPAKPWFEWGDQSHELANTAAFGNLKEGSDLADPYIKGTGNALAVVQRQLLVAGIRLAMLLDERFP